MNIAAVGTDRAAPPNPATAGAAHVRAVRCGDQTRLSHVRANSPLHLLTPNTSTPAAWIVAATFGGGLVGGDRIRLDLRLEPRACVLLSSQASTKVYRAAADVVTSQTCDAHVASGAVLAALPDPTVPFAGARFEQRQHYWLEDGASLAALDWMTSGRHAAGEHWLFHRYSTDTNIAYDRRALFHDRMTLDVCDGSILDRMGRFTIYALLVVVGPAFAAMAADALTSNARQPARRDADTIISAAPLADGRGAAVRVAADDVERASMVIRDLLRPVISVVGNDPWARRGMG